MFIFLEIKSKRNIHPYQIKGKNWGVLREKGEAWKMRVKDMSYGGKGSEKKERRQRCWKREKLRTGENIELTGCNLLFLLSRMIRKANNLEIQTNYKPTHKRSSKLIWWVSELVSRQDWQQIPLYVITFEKLFLLLAWWNYHRTLSEVWERVGATIPRGLRLLPYLSFPLFISFMRLLSNDNPLHQCSACKECPYLANEKC